MAKRKFSFLADEDEKHEQEYQRELAEEQKLSEKEAKLRLDNKGKRGVSMISGNPSPTVGEKVTYTVTQWYEGTPLLERNPLKVTWELFKKRTNGKFTTTNIKKTGISSFTFGEVASQYTYRLEAYLHKPEGGGLIINPQPAKVPKIGKIEFHYVDNKKGDTFSFYDKLRAKAHTTNLSGKELVFTLWEDDKKGSGHDPKNLVVEEKTERVDTNGLAIAEFQLTKALMKKAMKGEADAKELEFYVTVEYYKGKIHDSENVNVKNPLYWTPGVVPPPIGTKLPKEKGQPKAKGSPAEQKPISKKEEKGIITKATDYLSDFAESSGIMSKFREMTSSKPEGNSTVGVKAQKKEEKKEKCICQQYNLIWGNKVSCEFRKKVVEISKRQNFDPNHLMAVMKVETGGTFSSSKIDRVVVGHKKNGKPIKDYRGLSKDSILRLSENFDGAVGLIQFTPAAITDLNRAYGYKLTKRKLALMDQLEQLDYVEKYIMYWKKNNQISSKLTLADLYLVVFAPSKINGSDDETTLYEKDTKFYNANASIDTDHLNGITKKELAIRAYNAFSEGLINKEEKFECNNTSIQKDNKTNNGSWCDPIDYSTRTFYNSNGDSRPQNGAFGPVRTKIVNGTAIPKNHQGLDIFADINTPCKACLDGIIVSYTNEGANGYGNVLVLEVDGKDLRKAKREYKLEFSKEVEKGSGFDINSSKFYIRYAHLSSAIKTQGKVDAGDTICYTGDTGNAKGVPNPHLHLEIAMKPSQNGTGLTNRYNPAFFVRLKPINKDLQDKIKKKRS